MGLAASLAALTVRNGAVLALNGDGVSRLITWLSPDWHLWAYAPDFLAQSTWLGLLQAAVWVVAVVGCTWLVSWMAAQGTQQPSASRRGLAFLRADAGALLAVLAATGLMPLVMGGYLKPGPEPRDRNRVEMLDSFDPYARPIAVRLDPFSRLDARTVPTLFELSARPLPPASAKADETQLNTRFALPAGRYRIQVIGRTARADEDPLSGHLALRAGNWGGSIVDWLLEGTDSRQWINSFDLPADLGLVTFSTTGKLGRQIKELRLVPYRVVPFLDRIAAEDVGAAAPFDRLIFLFHDHNAYPEASGFWVRGTSSARVSVVSRAGRLTTELRLVLRSRVANTVRIEMPDRVWTETLAADEEREVIIKPTTLDGTVRLVITSERGFYPVDTDRGSTDRRHLGCYVQIIE